MSKVQYNKIVVNECEYFTDIIKNEVKLFHQDLTPIYTGDNDIYTNIYIIDNQLAGFITYKDLLTSYDIYMLAVLEPYRRQNIASKLIEPLFEKDTILEVRESNKVAIDFYLKHDFKIARKIKRYYLTEDGLGLLRSKDDN